MIDANLKPNAIEKIRAPKKPEIVLLICNWSFVLTKGAFIIEIVTFEP
jgi:hypothetical protein